MGAERKATLGVAPYTPKAVSETVRELRVATHMMSLASAYTATPTGPPKTHAAEVSLLLAAARLDFFTAVEGLTPDEASVATARLYGNVTRELTIPGGHLDAISRCQ